VPSHGTCNSSFARRGQNFGEPEKEAYKLRLTNDHAGQDETLHTTAGDFTLREGHNANVNDKLEYGGYMEYAEAVLALSLIFK
jgi:hypothetical protein